MNKRPTLKDIAAECGVSRTLVSIVLNGKEGKISCTDKCRHQIKETARKLGYTPNRLARSMSSGRPPVVAVMLNMDVAELFTGSYDYFNQLFPALTLELNKHDLEVMFIPCRSKEEQISRLERLTHEGLIGAVISNICPDNYTDFTRKLASSGFPYMILGYPYGEDCHCIYTTGTYSWLDEILARKTHIKNCWLLTRIQERHILCRYPFQHDHIWLAEKAEPLPEILDDPETLIVCAGSNLYRFYAGKIRNPFIIEQDRKAEFIPENIPCHLAKPSNMRSRIAETAAQQVACWLLEGKEPEVKQICINVPTTEK